MTFYLNKLSIALAAGDLTARALTETCLSAIATEDGKRAFIEVYTDRVRIEADQIDKAVQSVLDDGLRTKDIMSKNMKEVSTTDMGDAIIAKLK